MEPNRYHIIWNQSFQWNINNNLKYKIYYHFFVSYIQKNARHMNYEYRFFTFKYYNLHWLFKFNKWNVEFLPSLRETGTQLYPFRTVKWDPENIIVGKTKNNKEALKEKDLTHLYWKILAVYRACKGWLYWFS